MLVCGDFATQSVMMALISDSVAVDPIILLTHITDTYCLRSIKLLTLQYGINCTYLSRCSKRVLFGGDPSDDSKNDPSNLCESQTHTQAKLYLLVRSSNAPPLDSDTPLGVAIGCSFTTEKAQEPLDKVIDGCLYFLLFHR